MIVERNPFEKPTMEDWVSDYLAATSKSKRPPYVGIVHRLDRVTSGVLILAKKKGMLKQLNELFRLKKVQKTYLAIVENKPPKNKGHLQHHLFKNQKAKQADIFTKTRKGTKPCSLTYRLLDSNPTGHLLEIKPQTGQFHQIRAQLAFVGCPIVGDVKYGSEATYEKPLSVALHAWRLAFEHPLTGEGCVFEGQVPDFKIWTNFNTSFKANR